MPSAAPSAGKLRLAPAPAQSTSSLTSVRKVDATLCLSRLLSFVDVCGAMSARSCVRLPACLSVRPFVRPSLRLPVCPFASFAHLASFASWIGRFAEICRSNTHSACKRRLSARPNDAACSACSATCLLPAPAGNPFVMQPTQFVHRESVDKAKASSTWQRSTQLIWATDWLLIASEA